MAEYAIDASHPYWQGFVATVARRGVAAIPNSVAVAMCNRVGQEDDMLFAGESLLAGPDGSLICKAGAEEEIILVDFDPQKGRELRAQKPYTNLRRPEWYL